MAQVDYSDYIPFFTFFVCSVGIGKQAKMQSSCIMSQLTKKLAGHRKHVAHLWINWNLTSKADYVFGIALIFGKIIYIDLLQTQTIQSSPWFNKLKLTCKLLEGGDI